jgi:uncharacterized protein (DUF1778 family)
MSTANPTVSVRVSADERELLHAAATQARTTIGEFMRRKALEAAELDLPDQRHVVIPTADGEKFEAWAKAPGKSVPASRALAAARPPWRD